MANAAKEQKEGLSNRLVDLLAYVIGYTDAKNCFTKLDPVGCFNTALTAVPWSKMFKAGQVGYKAYKIWRDVEKAETLVKDTQEAAKIAEGAVEAKRLAAEESAASDASKTSFPLVSVYCRAVTWSEAEYLDCLQSERRGYAWVMQHHGGLTPEEAREAALERYPYEPDDAPYRGLVFHDEAWHWAMVAIHGDRYVLEHPELVHPSPEYQALE